MRLVFIGEPMFEILYEVRCPSGFLATQSLNRLRVPNKGETICYQVPPTLKRYFDQDEVELLVRKVVDYPATMRHKNTLRGCHDVAILFKGDAFNLSPL